MPSPIPRPQRRYLHNGQLDQPLVDPCPGHRIANDHVSRLQGLEVGYAVGRKRLALARASSDVRYVGGSEAAT